ncbi:MAG: N-acetylglucosamine kinase [Propionibacteriaceae bacterium]
MNHPAGSPTRKRARVVLGADVGGTSTRVAVATADGELLAVRTAGAGNPTSLGFEEAAARLAAVSTRALADAGVEPAEVSAAMLGMAGWSALRGREEEFCRVVLPSVPTVRLGVDIATAFSTAVADRVGVVSIAGTGAGTMRVRDGVVTDRRDGWGWLLGDRGSGTWLGTAALRATLTALEAGSPGPLATAVLAELGTTDLVGTIAVAYRHPPAQLSGLAPLVSRYAGTDPAAATIADRAAGEIVATIVSLGPDADEAIVLGGSVLTQDGPVSAGVRRRLAEGGYRTALLAGDGPAGSGVIGAVWIALGGLVDNPASVHRRLLDQALSDA